MPLDIDWSRLRTLRGSKQNAFEELCCQLARHEPIEGRLTFVRNGIPDGGVECLWRLTNGDEWGWQAKFLPERLKPEQWANIRKSFLDAAAKYPKLTNYYVCLPSDLADGRKPEQQSARQEWEQYRERWTKEAENLGRRVNLVRWGQSELLDRLTRDEHRGRFWFWFDRELFDANWFRQQFKAACSDARDKYSPTLNVDLTIANTLLAANPGSEFIEQFNRHACVIHQQARNIWNPENSKLVTALDSIDNVIREFGRTLQPAGQAGFSPHISFDRVRIAIDQGLDAGRRVLSKYLAAASANDKTSQDSLARLISNLRDFQEFLDSPNARVSCSPRVLVTGDAGQGKTHLLCHVAEKSIKAELPSLLFHGFHFSGSDPWECMMQRVDVKDHSRKEFLDALEATAEAHCCRVSILIDAINETDDRSFWPNCIGSFVREFRDRPWLSLVVTIRSSYLEPLLGSAREDLGLLELEHSGFQDQGHDAVLHFFAHFCLRPNLAWYPSEYSNPLFLKLLCTGLRDAGLSELPTGIQGFAKILEFFLEEKNRKISLTLGMDPKDKIVLQATRDIAAAMASQKASSIKRTLAKKLVEDLHRATRFEESLFYWLVSEGLLLESVAYTRDGHLDVVRFAYERMGDYQVAQELLRIVDFAPDRARDSLRSPQIGWVFAEARHPGLIEALTVQIPESSTHELIELLPSQDPSGIMNDAFVRSLATRRANAFHDTTFGMIHKDVWRDSRLRQKYLEVCVAVSASPGHPLNAKELDRKLRSYSLPDRDTFWIPFLHQSWKTDGTVRRLIEWIEKVEHFETNESSRLMATTLVWFLSSANRFLRDRTTKALVKLLKARLDILQTLLETFSSIDDPYVAERLLAACYGCAMLSRDGQQIASLAKVVRDWALKVRPVGILTRDSIRGVAERALSLGASLNFDIEELRPPYGSEWPGLELVSTDTIAAWKSKIDAEKLPGAARIYYDLIETRSSDFSQYQIGDLRAWSFLKLTDPPIDQAYGRFLDSLDSNQRKAYEALASEFGEHQNAKIATLPDLPKVLRDLTAPLDVASIDETTKSVIEQWLHETNAVRRQNQQNRESEFIETLRGRQDLLDHFQAIAKPNLRTNAGNREWPRFDKHLAQKWMFSRVLELGWTDERFGAFDAIADRSDDYNRSGFSNRIGMKYQRIALNELLGRLSDNYCFLGNSYGKNPKPFEGPWSDAGSREADPSLLIRKSKAVSVYRAQRCWWSPVVIHVPEVNGADSAHEGDAWLRSEEGLPEPVQLLRVTDPMNSSAWLSLQSGHHWAPAQTVDDDNDWKLRFTINVESFLVRNGSSKPIVSWLKKAQNEDARLPEPPRSSSDMYLGEFFWAPSFASMDCDYFGRPGWTDFGTLPAPVLVTADTYYMESTDDHSLQDQSISHYLPCKELAEGMGLVWGGTGAEFVDSDGVVVAQDPSATNVGPSALLIREDALTKYLKKEQLSLVWRISGFKVRVGPDGFLGRLRWHVIAVHDGTQLKGHRGRCRFEGS